MKHYK